MRGWFICKHVPNVHYDFNVCVSTISFSVYLFCFRTCIVCVHFNNIVQPHLQAVCGFLFFCYHTHACTHTHTHTHTLHSAIIIISVIIK